MFNDIDHKHVSNGHLSQMLWLRVNQLGNVCFPLSLSTMKQRIKESTFHTRTNRSYIQKFFYTPPGLLATAEFNGAV